MSSAQSQLSTEENKPASVLPFAPVPGTAAHTLWFAVQTRPWASLVVLPAGPGESAKDAANALYDVGALASGGPMRLIDAHDVTLTGSAAVILNMTSLVSAPGERRVGGPQRVVVLLSSVIELMAGIPIAMAADAVVLTVTLGKTRLEDARRTLELVGAQHVLGTILVPP